MFDRDWLYNDLEDLLRDGGDVLAAMIALLDAAELHPSEEEEEEDSDPEDS